MKSQQRNTAAPLQPECQMCPWLLTGTKEGLGKVFVNYFTYLETGEQVKGLEKTQSWQLNCNDCSDQKCIKLS